MSERSPFGIPLSESLCPDCDAELRFVTIEPGVTVIQILHDDTCPAYASMESRGGESA